MAVRQDKVQIQIDFITDESRRFAKTLLDTKEFNAQIASSKAKLAEYQKQLASVGNDEAKRGAILQKIAAEEQKVAANMAAIAAESRKVSAIDLSRLTPAQLTERAKQLAFYVGKNGIIPQSAPQFKVLETELGQVNTRLRDLNNSSKGIQQSGGGFSGVSSVVTRLTVGIGVAIGALKSFFSTLSGSGKLEQLNIAFETFLGSADKAKKVIADLRKFADVTPFETDQVNQAGRALLAFGFTADELIPTLTRIGDVASGTGKDFNELALIYGKAKTQGLIQGEELNQLAEAGIPIYAELAKVLGVNEKQIRKLGEQGKISFSSLEQVFRNLTGEGGRFAGLMERQSQSLEGLFSTAASALQNKLTNAMNDLLPAIKSITKGFIDLLTVPVSETLEKERQAFNGVALSALNAKEGTAERTKAIKSLQEQYPAFLGNIDAEKVTNEQLKPILDQINQSYVIRIALQKQQEKLQPLLEAQAEQENRLAEGRAAANRLLARGAELAGVNLQQFQTQAQQTEAVIAALNKTAQFRSAGGFDQPINEQAKVLNEIKANLSGIDATTVRTRFATQQATEAEKQRQEVVAELRKTYGEVFAILDKENAKSAAGPNADAAGVAAKKAEEAAKKLKEVIALELKEIEADTKRRELILENARIKEQINEVRYQEGISAVQENGLKKQLEVYKTYGKLKEVEALEIQNKLAEIEAGRAQRAATPLATLPGRVPGQVASNADGTDAAIERNQAGKQALLTALQDKFTAALIAEQDYELQKLEIKRLGLVEEINLLKNASKPQVDEIQKREEAKLKIEEDIAKKRRENSERLQQLERQALQEGTKALGDVFQISADLLSQDEKKKQKHAGVVKALQIANIQVNLAAEISGIFANAQKSAIAQLLGPVAGNVLATVQAALAVVRATAASAKIQNTKFARGVLLNFARGKMGFFGGKPHSAGGTKGVFEDGTVVEVEKDEAWAVVNKKNAPLLRTLSYVNALGGNGTPFFRDGGVLKFDTGGLQAPNTTPSIAAIAAAPANNGVQTDGLAQRLEAAAATMLDAARRFPRSVRSTVVYQDIEDAGVELDAVRDDAAL